MPPLVIEASLALAILVSAVRVTTSIGEIKQAQKEGHIELLGKVNVLTIKIEFLEKESTELKKEIKESRRHRYSDAN